MAILNTMFSSQGITISTGLNFPDTQNASADVNTLDDYEEGYATMTLTSQGGTITADTSYDQIAYTKIGRIVHFQGYINVSAISSPTGWTRMVGLPFNSSSLNESADTSSVSIRYNGLADDSGVEGAFSGYIAAGGDWFYIQGFDGTDAHNISEHVGVNTSFTVTGTYIAA